DQYTAHIGRMFALADLPYDAAKVVALETRLAAGHWDVVKRRDADLSYNLLTLDSLRTDLPQFDWTGWITATGATTEQWAEIVVRQPSFLE
ncbi:M13 family metallopeptidase N-terminal domain-containing protein, partial [Rhodococcus opacus]